MSAKRSAARALTALLCTLGAVPVQSADSGLAIGRQMLAEDNPGELWIDRGKRLFHEARGPKKATLERCDFGLGPGQLEGAAAQLPRYFADVDRVS